MLVLQRSKGECVVIGDPESDDCIVLLVNRVRGDLVSLAFEASPHITIDRAEVTQRKGKAASKKVAALLAKYHP